MSESLETILIEKARRDAWLKRLADEMEKLAPLLPGNPFPEQGTPAWLERVEAEFAKAVVPAAKLKKGKEMTPKRMGALIGHQCSNAVWMMEWFESGMEKGEATKIEKMDAEQVKKGVEIAGDIFGKWYPAMRRYAKLALCSCVDQSYEDMSAFLQGYADGFARKPKTFNIGEMGAMTFGIYAFMLFFWRFVERLNSVAELHQVLVKVFGPYRAGDLKRTEKICQRIGLRFREPGRPKKLK